MVIRSPDSQPGMWQPHSSPSRREIAHITFTDGSVVRFPSLASSFESPSSARAPVPSLSPVGHVGRNRSESFGTDLSSTDGTREAFNDLSVKRSRPINIPTGRKPDSSPPGYTPDALPTTVGPCYDYVGFGEECTSAAQQQRGRPQHHQIKSDPFDWSSDLQSHLVADADGPALDQGYAWPHLDDVDLAMNEFTEDLDRDAFFAFDPPPDAKHFSASAPAATSWVHRGGKHSSEHARSGLAAAASNTFDSAHLKLEPSYLERSTRKPGRQPGSRLPEEKRKKVALMRMIGACEYCKSGRRGCDPGTPCRPCVLHFGPELLKEPNYCRRSIVDTLLDLLLPEDPCPLAPNTALGGVSARDYLTTGWTIEIPLQFGSGPPLRRSVQIVELKHSRPAPVMANGAHLLPMIFADNGDLLTSIDRHVSARINCHFAQFNGHHTGIRVLEHVYNLYCYYRQAGQLQDYAALLHQALKLLVLIHDNALSVDAADPSVSRVMAQFAPGYVGGQLLSPYLLQAEVAKVVPQLARTLLADVLQRLLRTCLSRRCDQHPLVLAVFSVVMMSIESIMHHMTETSSFPAAPAGLSAPLADLVRKEEGANILLNLYKNCFENCHRLLLRPMEPHHIAALQKTYGTAPARFLAAINKLIRGGGDYLERTGCAQLDGIQNPSQHFDRQVARLLLLQSR